MSLSASGESKETEEVRSAGSESIPTHLIDHSSTRLAGIACNNLGSSFGLFDIGNWSDEPDSPLFIRHCRSPSPFDGANPIPHRMFALIRHLVCFSFSLKTKLHCDHSSCQLAQRRRIQVRRSTASVRLLPLTKFPRSLCSLRSNNETRMFVAAPPQLELISSAKV